MTTTKITQGEIRPKSIPEAHQALVASYEDRLAIGFRLLIKNVEPSELLSVDVDTILGDIQHLSEAAQALKGAILGGVK